MKNYIGLQNTVEQYFSRLSSGKKCKCEDCGLEFQSSAQLLNHKKKFCTNSGFDTLAGLNIRLKNPHHNQKKENKRIINDSLTNAMEEIQKNKTFIPQKKQFTNDLLDYQKHQEDIQYMRPYIHNPRKSNNQNVRKSKSLFVKQDYQSLRHIDKNQKDKYGQKSRAYYIDHSNQNYKSKAYSLTSSYMKKFKEQNGYISPPTQLKNLQNAKVFSVLDRSDMSIKNMPQQQKRQYVVRKILQLQNIEQTYKKNGGAKDEFIENTQKMKTFYQNLLEDINNHNESKFGRISNGTRVSTPISKLSQLKDSKVLAESITRLENSMPSKLAFKVSQINRKSMAKRQDKIRQRFNTQIPTNDILDQQLMKKIENRQKNNQIIVIPVNNPQPQYPPQNQNDFQIKYIQSIMKMKEQQNQKIVTLMEKQNSEIKQLYQKNSKARGVQVKNNEKKLKNLEQKYNKLIKQNRQNIQQQNINNFNRQRHETQPSVSNDSFYNNHQLQYLQNNPNRENNIRNLNLHEEGYYTPQKQQIQLQEKILLQMQKQQRDQLQLFSHLPQQVQKIKLDSIKEMSEKRFEMQKQIIKQKLQKLKFKQNIKHFQLDRLMTHEGIQSEKKKITIHKLMKKKIKDIAKQEFEVNSSDEDSNEEEQQQSARQYNHQNEPFDEEYGKQTKNSFKKNNISSLKNNPLTNTKRSQNN